MHFSKFLLLFLIVVASSCHQKQKPMQVASHAVKSLDMFIAKSKFDSSDKTIFQGLSQPALREPLSVLINQVATNFKQTVLNLPTEAKFQRNIEEGLQRFNPYYLQLDTEDRERICAYFEELMDCVGLESSDGQLNEWMYGFDPAKDSSPK